MLDFLDGKRNSLILGFSAYLMEVGLILAVEFKMNGLDWSWWK